MNQCMGCQAGWPTHTNKYGRHVVHRVIGGYEHEIVSCTKERYEDTRGHDPGDEDAAR
jgi:hypothetical protein